MSSWKINPSTGDYIMENGAPVSSDSLVYPAYYRLKIPRAGWLYAPNDLYGSDYWMVKKRTGAGSDSGLINIGNKALQPMIDDGRASDVDIETAAVSNLNRNNAALTVNITDIGGEVDKLELPQVF